MANKDPRLGFRKPDGTREWPETTVLGKPYTRPATTRNVGGGYFIVLDRALPEAVEPAVDEVKALVSAPTKPAKPVAESKES